MRTYKDEIEFERNFENNRIILSLTTKFNHVYDLSVKCNHLTVSHNDCENVFMIGRDTRCVIFKFKSFASYMMFKLKFNNLLTEYNQYKQSLIV